MICNFILFLAHYPFSYPTFKVEFCKAWENIKWWTNNHKIIVIIIFQDQALSFLQQIKSTKGWTFATCISPMALFNQYTHGIHCPWSSEKIQLKPSFMFLYDSYFGEVTIQSTSWKSAISKRHIAVRSCSCD